MTGITPPICVCYHCYVCTSRRPVSNEHPHTSDTHTHTHSVAPFRACTHLLRNFTFASAYLEMTHVSSLINRPIPVLYSEWSDYMALRVKPIDRSTVPACTSIPVYRRRSCACAPSQSRMRRYNCIRTTTTTPYNCMVARARSHCMHSVRDVCGRRAPCDTV